MPTSAVLISAIQQDHDFLRGVFAEEGWTFASARSLENPTTLLESAAVLITERDLPVGSWKEVLEIARALPNRPLVIVVSTHADDCLWAEALNLGAYDVIAKPFDRAEVIRVLRSAWIHQHSSGAAA